MDDIFERRVKAAAVAAWWLVLIAVGFHLVNWIAYQAIISAQPAWVLSIWGPGFDWAYVQIVWFWFIAGFKLSIWLMALAALWLTLWARQLRQQ